MDTVRFHLPSNENLYVDLKRKLSWGDGRALQEAKIGETGEDAGNLAFTARLLERSIVAWNLTDGQGRALEVTPENIDEHLTFEDAQGIVPEAVKGITVTKVNVPNSSTVSSRTSRRTARAN